MLCIFCNIRLTVKTLTRRYILFGELLYNFDVHAYIVSCFAYTHSIFIAYFSLCLSLCLSVSLSLSLSLSEYVDGRACAWEWRGGGGESVTAISSVKAQTCLHLAIQR